MVEAEEKQIEKSLIREIKSCYNVEKIFSFLEQRIKLDIIIYNKKLQKLFEVDIEDYKKICKRFIKGERNGKGKEYYSNGKLKFEAEYLNGKRWNGKGYNNEGHLEYELKNGCGKIKEYYSNGELAFQGEYSNGERKGKGKEYN